MKAPASGDPLLLLNPNLRRRLTQFRIVLTVHVVELVTFTVVIGLVEGHWSIEGLVGFVFVGGLLFCAAWNKPWGIASWFFVVTGFVGIGTAVAGDWSSLRIADLVIGVLLAPALLVTVIRTLEVRRQMPRSQVRPGLALRTKLGIEPGTAV